MEMKILTKLMVMKEEFDPKEAELLFTAKSILDTQILSQAFNLHSQVKYIHEPLLLTNYEGFSSIQKAEQLKNILRCNFQTLYRTGRKSWHTVYEVTGDAVQRTNKYQYEKVFCFERSKIDMDCPSEVQHLEKLCSLKLHKVVKLASVKYIKDLAELLEDDIQIHTCG